MTDLHQKWWHSFEEDHDDIRVYRPEGFPFPPARGRRGLELRPDGTFTEFAIGRGDAPQPVAGTWEAATEQERLDLTTESGERRSMRVTQLAPDRLEIEIRKQSQ